MRKEKKSKWELVDNGYKTMVILYSYHTIIKILNWLIKLKKIINILSFQTWVVCFFVVYGKGKSWDGVSYRLDWPWTHYIAKDDQEHPVIYFSLSRAWIISVPQHAQFSIWFLAV